MHRIEFQFSCFSQMLEKKLEDLKEEKRLQDKKEKELDEELGKYGKYAILMSEVA